MPKVTITIEIEADIEEHQVKEIGAKLAQGAELNIDENDNVENIKVTGIFGQFTQTINCLEDDLIQS